MTGSTWYRLLCLGMALCLPIISTAQTYPSKVVKIIVPTAPGGFTDVVARLVGQKLSASLGQQVVIENKQGAGSTIGADAVAKAAPDGHTLLMSSTTHVLGQAVYGRLPYDPIKSFTPVAKLVDSAYVLVVNTKTDFKSVQDLINFARTHPEQIHYASSGNGSSQHLMGAMFCAMTNVKLKHVPYRGSAGATTDLLAGVVETSFAGLPNVLSLIQQGKLRALAVTTAKRIEQLPDVPTLSEAGVSGYDASIWLALLAPAGTPPEIVQRLNKDLMRSMTSTDASKTMFDVGVSLSLLSPADTGEMMVSEMQRWSKVIRDNAIKPE